MAFQAPYYKPSLPFSGQIYGGLRGGMLVIINGTIFPTCTRFQVDFQCGSGSSPRPDIALHFNPRFDEGCVVANTLESGKWQQEERRKDLPFRKGQGFELRFHVKSHSFEVIVNGRHYSEFKHRIAFSRVDTIGVSGSLDVASISFQGATQNAASPSGPCILPQTYSVPYQTCIYGGLFPSKSIIVAGTVSPVATRFHVNLKAGQDIALHLNPRFNENVFVRNSKLRGAWGSEERSLPSGMPFSRGQPFSIWILCEPQCFMVAVNGQHQFAYNHRCPNLQQVNQLEVEGDVCLSNVQI
ncbi:galectin-9 isoform X2 [Hemicordylus capensis]|uniref:galectin-9 isoform X2 n=1 Tax=Hemicordylus capensis TaxID=884348 RepID=UPI0023047E09|nr:galectin-9 isoform X2 [Hemicordylus capensis]